MSGGENKKACLGSGYARNIGYIEEILVNILLKLPVLSVVNFMLVAKHWLRLIGETRFAQSHFSSFPKITKYILYLYRDESDGKTLYTVDVDMDRNRTIMPYVAIPSLFRKSSVISSFNGLLCFTKPVESSDTDIKIQLCNPATREVLELPDGSPSSETPSIGVVFDPDRNRFIVLRFFCEPSESDSESDEDISYQCEIYTPGVGHWRGIGVVEPPVPSPFCRFFPTHVSVGGIMYWLVWSEDEDNIPDYILSVDMDENFARIELPPYEFNGFTFLIQYEGGLGLVSVDNSELGVDVWSLEGSEWSHVGYADLAIDDHIEGINCILSIRGELLFVFTPRRGEPYVFQFLNLAANTWTTPELEDMCRECTAVEDKLNNGPSQPIVFPFVESLFRCDGSN